MGNRREVGRGGQPRGAKALVPAKPRRGARKSTPTPEEPEVQQVPLASIDLEDRTFQYCEPADVEEFVRSMPVHGQLSAVGLLASARGGLLRILFGFRRIEAALRLEWPTVAGRVYRISEQEARQLAFVENAVRRNLSRLEKANAIHQARRHELSVKEIASGFGLSEKQILRYLALLDFPAAVRAAWEEDRIRLTHAKILADAHLDDVEGWIQKIEAGKWSARELQRELRKAFGAASPGRNRRFFRIGKKGVRGYEFELSKGASAAERERLITAMSEVIEHLKGWG